MKGGVRGLFLMTARERTKVVVGGGRLSVG